MLVDLLQAEEMHSAIAGAITELDPEVIGISIRNIDDQNRHNTRFFFEEDNQVISLARKLSKAPIILGGAGYSMFPDAILDASEADIGIEGEGEAIFTTVLNRLAKNEPLEGLPGVHVKDRGLMAKRLLIRQPDDFALPDPDLLFVPTSDMSDLWIPVQTRRGCPMGCSYCSTGKIEGTVTRKRSPKNVVEWMAKLQSRGLHQFYFVDNTFNLPPSYAISLCKEMAKASLGLKWRCILYPSRIDEALIESMAEAGCFEAAVGFESGDEKMLKGMNKRFGREDIVHASALLKQYGIRQMGFLLLGGPGETRESVKESLLFADSLGLESMRITIGIRIYPGTALAEQACREGVISPDDDLLRPQFYIVAGLEDEIRGAVDRYAASRPNWIV
jgi:radical SAM superfamily enzyme YgiQ (UPF0313 family)